MRLCGGVAEEWTGDCNAEGLNRQLQQRFNNIKHNHVHVMHSQSTLEVPSGTLHCLKNGTIFP